MIWRLSRRSHLERILSSSTFPPPDKGSARPGRVRSARLGGGVVALDALRTRMDGIVLLDAIPLRHAAGVEGGGVSELRARGGAIVREGAR